MFKNKTKSLSKEHNKKKERKSISPFQKKYNDKNRKNNHSLNIKDNYHKINIREFINQVKKNSLKKRIAFNQKYSNSFSRAETDSNILKVNQSMNLGFHYLNKSKEKKHFNISKIPLCKKQFNINFSYSNKQVVTEENKINSREKLRQNFLKNFPKHTHSNTNTSIIFIKNNYSASKNYYDEPKKLYIDSGRSNNKNKNNINNSNNNNKNNEYEKLINLKDEFNKIENKIKESLNNNITYTKSKRYNIIQNLFEETIKILPEENKSLFRTILNEIHDVFYNYSKENRKLKEENELYRNKVFSLEKEKIYNNKIIIEKNNEIDFLKKEIINLNLNLNNNKNSLSQRINSSIYYSNDNSIKENEENKVDKFNKQNYEDLDALYFKDKIKMNNYYKFIPQNKKEEIIPPLNFNFEEIFEEQRKKNYEKLSFIEKVKLSLNLD